MLNATQALLDQAHAERTYQDDLQAIRVREAIRPLERRRLHVLALMVKAQGNCRRRAY